MITQPKHPKPAESPPDGPAGDRALETSTLIVTTFASFIGPFMISAVNVALPAIQADFDIGAVLLSWIATAFLLASAVLLVPFGKVADIYGRKRVFVLGMSLFALASLLAAFAPSVEILILLRIFQGAGAAMMVTTGMAIITDVFPFPRRGRAIGIYVAAVYVGLSVGPTVGGVLTQHLGWRSVFLVTAPLGFISVLITLKFLKKEWKGAEGEQFDLTGSIVYGISLVALIYGASRLPALSAGLIAGSGLAGLFLFVRHEQKTRFPVFDVGLFQHNRVFAFSSLAALIHYAVTFAITFMMSLYLQYAKGLDAQTAGLVLVSQPIVMALFSPVAGRLSDKIEPRLIASSGMALTGLGLLQLVFLSPASPLPYIIGILLMLGLGFALFSSPNMNAIMSSVEKRHLGIASGAVATMRLLGQMLSMATATVVFAIILGSSRITASNPLQFLKSQRVLFLIFVVLCGVGLLFSIYRGSLRPESGHHGPSGK